MFFRCGEDVDVVVLDECLQEGFEVGPKEKGVYEFIFLLYSFFSI